MLYNLGGQVHSYTTMLRTPLQMPQNPKQPIRNIATVHEVNEQDHEIGTNPICEQRRLMMRLHICPVSQEPPLLTHIQTH